MKIGMSFSPYGKTYGRYGKDKFSKTKQHGYDAVDYNLSDTNVELYSLNENDLKIKIEAEKASAQSAGIAISQVHGPWRWPPRDSSEQERAERMDKMKKAVVITSMLGCKYLVVHPIMPFGTEDLKDKKEQETWDLNIIFFRELVGFAKERDVIICLENMPMPEFSLATPEKVLDLVKTLDADNCNICLDTGHVAVFPELAVGDEVRRLGHHLKVLHIHDNKGDKDSHLYPTKGIADWGGFLDAIEEVGFHGVLSLEASPSGALEDDEFEKESINLHKMFNGMILEHQKSAI